MSVKSESPINREFLSNMCDDDVEFETELLEAFLEASPGVLEQMRAGVDSSDADVVRAAAHTLKGSSRAIGANHVGEVCETLEIKAREADLDGTAELLEQVEARYGEVAAYIRANWATA